MYLKGRESSREFNIQQIMALKDVKDMATEERYEHDVCGFDPGFEYSC